MKMMMSILALTALLAVPATDALAKPGHGKGHAYGHAKQANKDHRQARVRTRTVWRNQYTGVRRVRVAPVVVNRNSYGANARYGRWSTLDRNTDGMLERWEWPHSRSLFDAIDRNNDGLVSQWELRESVR